MLNLDPVTTAEPEEDEAEKKSDITISPIATAEDMDTLWQPASELATRIVEKLNNVDVTFHCKVFSWGNLLEMETNFHVPDSEYIDGVSTPQLEEKKRSVTETRMVFMFEKVTGAAIPITGSKKGPAGKVAYLREKFSESELERLFQSFHLSCGGWHDASWHSDYLDLKVDEVGSKATFSSFEEIVSANDTQYEFAISTVNENNTSEDSSKITKVFKLTGLNSDDVEFIEKSAKEPEVSLMPPRDPKTNKLDMSAKRIQATNEPSYVQEKAAASNRKIVTAIDKCIPIPGETFEEKNVWLSKRPAGEVNRLYKFIEGTILYGTANYGFF